VSFGNPCDTQKMSADAHMLTVMAERPLVAVKKGSYLRNDLDGWCYRKPVEECEMRIASG